MYKTFAFLRTVCMFCLYFVLLRLQDRLTQSTAVKMYRKYKHLILIWYVMIFAANVDQLTIPVSPLLYKDTT